MVKVLVCSSRACLASLTALAKVLFGKVIWSAWVLVCRDWVLPSQSKSTFQSVIVQNFVACKIESEWLRLRFIGKESGVRRFLPTKRAADLRESARFMDIFLAGSFFHISSLVHARPQSANANRWAGKLEICIIESGRKIS